MTITEDGISIDLPEKYPILSVRTAVRMPRFPLNQMVTGQFTAGIAIRNTVPKDFNCRILLLTFRIIINPYDFENLHKT